MYKKIVTNIVIVLAAAVIINFLGLYILGPNISGLIFGVLYHNFHFKLDTVFRLLNIMTSFVGPLILIFLWVKLVERRPFSSIGLKKEGAFKNIFIGAILGFAMFSILLIVLLIGHFAKFESIKPSFTLSILLLFVGFFFQSSVEEILTRGWILSTLKNRYGKIIAVIFSSLFFAYMHMNNSNIDIIAVLVTFLFGVLMSLLVLITNNLWFSCACHALWNFTESVVFGFEVSGNNIGVNLYKIKPIGAKIFSGGNYGPEGSIFLLILFVIFIIFALLYMKKRNRIQ